MEDIKVTAIVLNAMPYKEKDKLIHLFSVELGNITAVLKGVSSPNAKLKFAGQPFCFATFDLVKSRDFYIIKSADLIDTFFDITSDYDNFMYSNAMLETCSIILKPNIISEGLFLTLIKSLQNIVYNKIDTKLAVLKFFCDTLGIIGYALNFDICDNCGMKFMGDIKFDFASGTFRCFNCSGGIKVSQQEFMLLKIVSSTVIDRLHTIKIKQELLDRLLELVVSDLNFRLNKKLKSLESL